MSYFRAGGGGMYEETIRTLPHFITDKVLPDGELRRAPQ